VIGIGEREESSSEVQSLIFDQSLLYKALLLLQEADILS